ncbi:NAD-dependent epimerase/dehydratase family protein [Streptomyces gardneri]|uniref:NAD-dependent epimerase/dehydratase family protein n=1 Tax=Nocardia TaxID=1817 RepID=UPI00135C675D|nr:MULTISPECIES: NAD-dependent epimerase/dehydratase family protein [Nocardia]MBF6168446.1 NAD-dependent epimerase/dehydratase family protein [Streptomyces gardneri]MBF6207709.1 NAD-dependent epimerase/dehydratase family protein [Streptomyces gardneri]
MKVAVTGAAGYLGTNLLRLLIERGHQVTAIDRAIPAETATPGVTWVRGDVLDPASMRAALEGAELVYHLVAVITLAEKNDLAWRVNTEGVRVVAEAALAVGARRMVHASSIHAFNQYSCGGRIDESAPRSTDPTLPVYDRSKWAGEVELRKVIDRGLDAVLCNPTGVFGPLDHGKPLSRINRTLKDAALGRIPAMIGGGFDLVDVRDVAEGLILAGERGRTGENYLLGGSMISMLELCRIAATHGGKRGPKFAISPKLVSGVIPVLAPIGKLFNSDIVSKAALGALISAPVVDHAKAERELGYRPRPLDETVRDLVAFFGEPIRITPSDTRRIA